VDFKEDIQNLSFPNAQYDLILCNHVIEHVPKDEMALKEISRILKPNGKAIITIPGNYQRDNTIYFNHLRFNGHYRDYMDWT
jgi:ubiquinone/menaquinone biosynthesis C-methylase UbiE